MNNKDLEENFKENGNLLKKLSEEGFIGTPQPLTENKPEVFYSEYFTKFENEIMKRLENIEKEITDIPELIIIPIRATATIPSYAHEGDSGLDLFSAIDYTLAPGEKGIVPTGLVFAIPKTEWRTFDVTIKGRSGNDSKGVNVVTNIMIFDDENGDTETQVTERKEVIIRTGTVDNVYTGEIGIIVKNNSYETITIPAGTKLAQGIVREVIIPKIKVGTREDIPETTRGSEGYGSTDKK